jgi:Na+-transporting NADH:ubiquinone oxidoreductase subunit C
MTEESLARTLSVATGVALGCALMVSTAVYLLRPMQLAYANLERNRIVVEVAGLAPADSDLSDRALVALFVDLQVRIVDLETDQFTDDVDPQLYDQRAASSDPELSVAIPDPLDQARLGRRARYVPVYLLMDGDQINRIVLPVSGQGMWSTLYGYLSLESDLNTIAEMRIYEHGETAGIGDRIQDPRWQNQWIGRQLYDDAGELRFRVTRDASLPFEVDIISGASVTAEGVGNLVRYWLGEHGFAPLLAQLRMSGAEVESN